MKDELTINQNYVLRKGLDDQYSLYNKSIQKRYELSYKLFFILNLFRHSSLSLGYMKEKFENMGINMDDFWFSEKSGVHRLISSDKGIILYT